MHNLKKHPSLERLRRCIYVLPFWVFALAHAQPSADLPSPLHDQPMGWLAHQGQLLTVEGTPFQKPCYYTRLPDVSVFHTAQGLQYQFAVPTDTTDARDSYAYPLHKSEYDKLPAPSPVRLYSLGMNLLGARAEASMAAYEPTGYHENYYLPRCPDGITKVRGYTRVITHSAYEGIDWVVHHQGNSLKHEFRVAPGADPSQIRWQVRGADSLKVLPDGALAIYTPYGVLTEQAPMSWQGDARMPVASHFELMDSVVSIALGEYDPTAPLTIDPDLMWGTYYGGGTFVVDRAWGGNTDAHSSSYLVGETATWISLVIATPGAHQDSLVGGPNDGFIAKFDSLGNRLWATYYGGSIRDVGFDCVADDSGNVFFTGLTMSQTGISFQGHQNTFGGGSNDAFLVKFDINGVRQWATYLGGNRHDEAFSCAIGAGGEIYVGGWTYSTSGLAVNGFQNTFAGARNGFLAQYTPSGSLNWCTYYGGLREWVYDCATDTLGNVYAVGVTQNPSGMASPGAYRTSLQGRDDAYAVKFDSLGNRLWATYLGGDSTDNGIGCAVTPDGHLYVAMWTLSLSGIAKNAYQPQLGGDSDGAICKLSPDGDYLWGTYYGGPGGQWGQYCAVDRKGNVYLAGRTGADTALSTPLTAHQPNYGGGSSDTYLVKFDSAGNRLWATYHGGGGFDVPNACAIDPYGHLHLFGTTGSGNNIAFQGHQNTFGGNLDAYIAKFACPPVAGDTLSFTGCDSVMVAGQTYVSSGLYPQAAVSKDGCDSTYFFSIDLTPAPSAQASLVGDSLVAQSVADSYQWLVCSELGNSTLAGATDSVFSPTTTGNYALVASNGTCTDTSDCIAFVLTHRQEQEEVFTSWDIALYPNPTREQVRVEGGPNWHTFLRVEVFTALGQKQADLSFENSRAVSPQAVVSVKNWPRGAYLVRVSDGRRTGYQMLMVQ